MLKYCVRCVMPQTKPDLHMDTEGVCSACRSFESRKEVDWAQREKELLLLLKKFKSNDSNWDCIVPVSGGKDSTYQVVRMLQLGLNPLCVTSTTCDLSDLGRTNIENIKHLGVDYVEFSPNPLIRAKLNKIGLTEVGDISWPEHVGIFTIPVRAAVQYKVPLIVWGENSQNEYGGPAAAAENNTLTRGWLEEFGGLLGLRVSDLSEVYGIESKFLLPYQYPSDAELQQVGVTGLFLGHYYPWDGLANTLIAQAHGFTSLDKAVEGSMVNYENLDNYQTGIHDYFKFLKFGFSRTTDIACLHLRRGRITRKDALDIVQVRDGKFPWTYLGKSLHDILELLDITVDEFIRICDRFTNKKIFKRDASGALIKDKDGNLEKLNYDNL
ncbi:N-acetyl sugar amidotransferase [uncultured Paraglaciecola sp.]|uniref:N-acetyl sugar amidotransferase n=1 Tax=uncultured Paraglaciecola sp. TaxID=1765024 RepID=UPI002601070D|nr:N-acetyl sugar amidotransferase [uncultured Paraglaciecola sp.]